jgi:hypothetical protein
MGRAKAEVGSKTLTMIYVDDEYVPAHTLQAGDDVQVEGSMYTIVSVSGATVTLDEPIKLRLPAGMRQQDDAPMPPTLEKKGEVWVYVEMRAPSMNLDHQLLLLSMGAHKAAIQLLSLPFTADTILAQDLETRAVLRACYRLIKAMTTDCPKAQLEFQPSLQMFLDHTHAYLVAQDVSPSDTITAIFKDNRTVHAARTDRFEWPVLRPSRRVLTVPTPVCSSSGRCAPSSKNRPCVASSISRVRRTRHASRASCAASSACRAS